MTYFPRRERHCHSELCFLLAVRLLYIVSERVLLQGPCVCPSVCVCVCHKMSSTTQEAVIWPIGSPQRGIVKNVEIVLQGHRVTLKCDLERKRLKSLTSPSSAKWYPIFKWFTYSNDGPPSVTIMSISGISLLVTSKCGKGHFHTNGHMGYL